MKTRRKKRRMLTRFEPRRSEGRWTLVYDRKPSGHAPVRDRWYVATLGSTHVLGPYYRGTAEAVFEALVKIAPRGRRDTGGVLDR